MNNKVPLILVETEIELCNRVKITNMDTLYRLLILICIFLILQGSIPKIIIIFRIQVILSLI